ncbi:MAG: TetR/AcrR family transcriptional regulator [Anaerolineae bacterium]
MMAQARADDTRLRILDAAEACFAAHGYDGAGMAEICARAGVSRGAFYHHFAGKQAVFLALLERWLAGLEAQLAAARENAADVPEAIERMANVSRTIFRDGRGRLPLFLEFWAQATHDPAVWQATIAPYHRYRSVFARLLEQGAAQGSLVCADPDGAARILVGLALGLFLQGLLDPAGADWGEALESGLRLFLRGLGNGDTDNTDGDG